MIISPLQPGDLSQLAAIQPDGWTDIRASFEFYLQHSFCHPVAVREGQEIIGVGSCIIHPSTAWLCHIIVHPEKRGIGIGKFITDQLIAIIEKVSTVKTILLLATKLGAPVYRKSGFEVESEYIFYKDGEIQEMDSGTTLCSDGQFDQVLALDRRISGEERSLLLSFHKRECVVKLVDGKVAGCYFPALGDGLIISRSPSVGLDLMRLRAQREVRFIIPEQNVVAARFLLQHGYRSFLTGTRMRLGKEISWRPECLYNRIGGNLG